jgi:two-component system, chemotaxis family, protein-glutamate methylesterase/glutaminase
VVDIAPGDWHRELGHDLRVRLQQEEPENFCRPSVDVLFRTAALATSGRLLGVTLTGMGSDVLAGCRAVRAAGGAVLVQDAATSVIWGMPGAVANAGLANKILPLDALASEMVRVAGAAAPGNTTAERVAV